MSRLSRLLLVLTALVVTLPNGYGCRPVSRAIPLPGDQPEPLWPGDGLAGLRAGPAATPWCGADVWLSAVLPDPVDAPDRVAEWIEITHAEAIPVELTGWRLQIGKRTLDLSETHLEVGETARLLAGRGTARSLGSLRLRNRSGVARLLDPCGTVAASLAWGCPAPEPGTQVVVLAPWHAQDARGPTRQVASGAGGVGGCGQT